MDLMQYANYKQPIIIDHNLHRCDYVRPAAVKRVNVLKKWFEDNGAIIIGESIYLPSKYCWSYHASLDEKIWPCINTEFDQWMEFTTAQSNINDVKNALIQQFHVKQDNMGIIQFENGVYQNGTK